MLKVLENHQGVVDCQLVVVVVVCVVVWYSVEVVAPLVVVSGSYHCLLHGAREMR